MRLTMVTFVPHHMCMLYSHRQRRVLVNKERRRIKRKAAALKREEGSIYYIPEHTTYPKTGSHTRSNLHHFVVVVVVVVFLEQVTLESQPGYL